MALDRGVCTDAPSTVLVGTDDGLCEVHASCGASTPRPGCGWCGATGTCHAGTRSGPSGRACAGAWAWVGTDCRDAATDVNLEATVLDAAGESGVDASVPEACVPDCAERTCGPDGCGGSCGTCTTGTCDATGHCVTSGGGSCPDRSSCLEVSRYLDDVGYCRTVGLGTRDVLPVMHNACGSSVYCRVCGTWGSRARQCEDFTFSAGQSIGGWASFFTWCDADGVAWVCTTPGSLAACLGALPR